LDVGNPAGVKRDFEALEKRRLEAIGLLEKNDLNQSEVARRIHVCRQTVSRWMDEFRDGGREALQKAGRAGRKPELTEADRERLEDLLLKGPEQLGYETPLWTCARVAHLIEDEFGVAYHPAMSGRSSTIWAGAASGRWDEPASGTRKPSAAGGACAGPPKKKRARKDARSSSSTKAG
jgi:transposase